MAPLSGVVERLRRTSKTTRQNGWPAVEPKSELEAPREKLAPALYESSVDTPRSSGANGLKHWMSRSAYTPPYV